jgi:hypothetical protein
VNGDLTINSHDVLPSLEGLSGIATVNGELAITYNHCLSQSDALTFAAGVNVGIPPVNVTANGENYPCV